MGESDQSNFPLATRKRRAFLNRAGKSSCVAANASMRFFTDPSTCEMESESKTNITDIPFDAMALRFSQIKFNQIVN